MLDSRFQDDREGISLIHGSFARREEQACLTRMHRVQRLLALIYDKHVRHDVLLSEPPLLRVRLASTKLSGGISGEHWLNPLHLFNSPVLELRAGRAPAGRNWNTS